MKTAIAPELIDVFSLPSVPFSARRKLPHCPAIYFVLEGKSVIYIGQTNSLLLRWQAHNKRKELRKRGTELSIAWIEFSGEELLCQIEQALINWFKPELNSYGLLSTDANSSRLEGLLARAKMTPEQAGERLGKSSQTIRNWVAGRTIPKLEPDEYLQTLEVFGCTPKEFAEAVRITTQRPKQRKKPGRKKGS